MRCAESGALVNSLNEVSGAEDDDVSPVPFEAFVVAVANPGVDVSAVDFARPVAGWAIQVGALIPMDLASEAPPHV